MTDRKAYQREWMRKYRADKPTSRVKRLEATIASIAELAADKKGPTWDKLREVLEEVRT